MHRKFLISIAIFFSATAVVLMLISDATVAFSADVFNPNEGCECESRKNEATEIIYENTKCSDCHCEPSGKPLIMAHGTWADCERLDVETVIRKCIADGDTEASCKNNVDLRSAKNSCYKEHSQLTQICSKMGAGREDCRVRNGNTSWKSYYGGSGTFVVQNSITTNGVRTYFLGFDADGKHKIMSSFSDLANPITFRENSRDVELASDLYIGPAGKKELTLSSNKAAIFLNSKDEKVEFSRFKTEDGVSGIAVDEEFSAGFKRGGVYNEKYKDLYFSTNGNDIMMLPDRSAKRSEVYVHEPGVKLTDFQRKNKGRADVKDYYPMNMEKGLEVDGNVAVQNFLLDGKSSYVTRGIGNSLILFYSKQHNDTFTGSGNDIKPWRREDY